MSPNCTLTDYNSVTDVSDISPEMDPELMPPTLPFDGNTDMSLPITPCTPIPLVDLGYGSTAPPENNDHGGQIGAPSAGARAPRLSPADYAPYIRALWPDPHDEAIQLTPFYMSLYTAVKNTAVPNYLGAMIPIPSQMNCDAWRDALVGYWDAEVATFLRYGWPGSYTAPTPPTPSPRNHPSALAFASHVDDFLQKEVALGAMLGPFVSPPFEGWFQTSPLMTVAKKGSDKRRIIVDLSFPIGNSVNDGVLKNHFQGNPCSFKLPTVTDLADIIAGLGPGSFLWKADLERAYRQLRCDPLDYPLMGVKHCGQFFTDICPSFGCRGSATAQQRVSTAVCHLMSKSNHHLLAYIDDFCGAHATHYEALKAFNDFHELCDTLGLKLAPEKSAPPSTSMEWLGFSFDTVSMEITLPRDKLSELISLADHWKVRERCSRRDLQKLAGTLNHVAQCVPPARRFMSRILALLRSAPPRGTIPVNEDLRKDVAWFPAYAAECNGKRLIKADLPLMELQCDACPTGAGGFSPTHYYSLTFSPEVAEAHHISRLEAANAVLAIKTLVPPHIRNVEVVVVTVNSATMYTLTTGKTRDPVLAACSRELWLLAALQELVITVRHAPGHTLVLADALSRRTLAPEFERIVSNHVTDLNLTFRQPIDVTDILTDSL